MGKRTSEGYLGIAKQSAKGSPQTPLKFVRLSAADTIEALQEISVYRELEGDQLVSNIVKNIHKTDGTFTFFARPDLLGAIYAWILGKDIIGGASPWMHTITHANTIPWLTIEKYLDTVEQISDCKINQVVIEGTSGQPVTVEVSFLGINSEILASPQTATYEENDKFMFYHGKDYYGLDESQVANICFFRVTILRNLTTDSQHTDFLRSDLLELGLDIEVELRLKFVDSNFYKKVLYQQVGEHMIPYSVLDGGDIGINLHYGTDAARRQFEIRLPSLKHIAVQKFLDPEPAELELTCVSKAIMPATGEIITVVATNEYNAEYIP